MPSIRSIFSYFIIIFLAPALSQPGWASKVKPLNLEQITHSAQTIFEGECTAVRSGKDPETGLIATWYTFRVNRGIKGKIAETFTFKQYGGSTETKRVTIHAAHYEKGEKIVLFLYGTSKLGFTSAVGIQQGKFAIGEIPKTKTQYVTNGRPASMLFANSPKMLPTLTAKGLRATGIEKLRSERIELNDFLTEIERLVNAERKKDK